MTLSLSLCFCQLPSRQQSRICGRLPHYLAVQKYFADSAIPQIRLATKLIWVQQGLNRNRMGAAASSKSRKISRSDRIQCPTLTGNRRQMEEWRRRTNETKLARLVRSYQWHSLMFSANRRLNICIYRCSIYRLHIDSARREVACLVCFLSLCETHRSVDNIDTTHVRNKWRPFVKAVLSVSLKCGEFLD